MAADERQQLSHVTAKTRNARFGQATRVPTTGRSASSCQRWTHMSLMVHEVEMGAIGTTDEAALGYYVVKWLREEAGKWDRLEYDVDNDNSNESKEQSEEESKEESE